MAMLKETTLILFHIVLLCIVVIPDVNNCKDQLLNHIYMHKQILDLPLCVNSQLQDTMVKSHFKRKKMQI